MPEDKKEKHGEPLVFEFPEGKITIYFNWNEWYLSPKEDFANKNRTYLSTEWFHEKLKDNFLGVCKLAAVFDHECDFRKGEITIAKYHMDLTDFIGNGNMDTDIYAMEVFAQDATGCDELHWW